jgi:hypothetical protein
LQVVLTNVPEQHSSTVQGATLPGRPESSSYDLPFSRVVYIEATDFRLQDSKDYYGLAPGKSAMLRCVVELQRWCCLHLLVATIALVVLPSLSSGLSCVQCVVYIEATDFRLQDSKDFYGLAPGKSTMLRCVVTLLCCHWGVDACCRMAW